MKYRVAWVKKSDIMRGEIHKGQLLSLEDAQAWARECNETSPDFYHFLETEEGETMPTEGWRRETLQQIRAKP